MSYTKAQVRELARINLSRLSSRQLGNLALDALCTVALDIYARTTLAFEQESAINTVADQSNVPLPTGFIEPSHKHALHVGTGVLSQALIIPLDELETLQEEGPGSSYYYAAIDDANGVIEFYPTPSEIIACRFRNNYVPSIPTAEATAYPEPLELRPFIQCVRIALYDFLDDPERAETARQVFEATYVPGILKRLKERRMPKIAVTRFRKLG